MEFLSSIKDALFNFLFPRSSRVVALEKLSPGELFKLLSRAPKLEEGHTLAIFEYANPVAKEIIWEVKYGGNTILADKLGEILYDIVVDEIAERGILAGNKDSRLVLIPVPIPDKRKFERGWNQAELLTSAIKKVDKGGVFKHLTGQLVKIRYTESQTRTASRTERLRNLADSMLVQNPDSVRGKFVVVVDDVTTTGSTFAEVRRALRAAGARKILCVAVCH